MAERHDAIARVLARVLILNLAVAGAKLVFGYATGTVSILSDGFHSLTDGASNVIGLVGRVRGVVYDPLMLRADLALFGAHPGFAFEKLVLPGRKRWLYFC